MCLSPQTCKSSMSSFYKEKNSDKYSSKDDIDKQTKRKLSSRNNENPKKNKCEKKIHNMPQFSSNISTSSNTSNLNCLKTHNQIIRENEKVKDSISMRRNIKSFIKQNSSNIFTNNSKEKMDYLIQKYKKKINYHFQNNNNHNNRSMNKNISQDLIISKVIDRLVINNLTKINKYCLKLKVGQRINNEKNLLSSATNKEFNPYLYTKNQNLFNLPITKIYKNIKSVNNLNLHQKSKHTVLTSSTGNLYAYSSKKIQGSTERQMKSNYNDLLDRNNNKRNKRNSSCNSNKNYNFNEIRNVNLIAPSKSKDNICCNNLNINTANNSNPKKTPLGIGLNNNKIGYVQINLFNNEKINDDNNCQKYTCPSTIIDSKNKYENFDKTPERIVSKNQKEKQMKIIETKDINNNCYFEDEISFTKQILLKNKSPLKNDLEIASPEENHFHAISFLQFLKTNEKKYV